MSEKTRDQWEQLGRRCQRAEATLRALGACVVRHDTVVGEYVDGDAPLPGGWVIPDYMVQRLDGPYLNLAGFLASSAFWQIPVGE